MASSDVILSCGKRGSRWVLQYGEETVLTDYHEEPIQFAAEMTRDRAEPAPSFPSRNAVSSDLLHAPSLAPWAGHLVLSLRNESVDVVGRDRVTQPIARWDSFEGFE
jgi:hypothetical protein